jgi:hypothetical protein
MTFEESPPTEAELRDAELLARALETSARAAGDPAPVDDALGAAWMLRASRRAELSELRARAVLDRAWPKRAWPLRAAAGALVAAAAALAILVLRPRGPAELPRPPVPLLQAQIAAARPGAPAALAALEAESTAYRSQLYRALGRAYGGRR